MAQAGNRGTLPCAAANLRLWMVGGEPEALRPPIADRLRTAQFAAATQRSTAMAFANIGNGLVIVVLAINGPQMDAALVWLAMLLAYWSPYAFKWWKRRGKAAPSEIPELTVRRLVRHAFGLGLLWAAVSVLMFDVHRGKHFVAAMVSISMLCGGAAALATVPAAAFAFMLPLSGGMLFAAMFGAHVSVHFLAAPLQVAYTGVLIGFEFSLARDFNRQIIAQAHAELAARHDPLTGLNNRAAFDLALAEAFARYARKGERFALFSLDLDRFKCVNDRLGHQAGDELLRRVADRLRDAVDQRGTLARVGGDEFAIVTRSPGDRQAAQALADDIASRFDLAFALEAGSVICRASVGVALAPIDGDNPKSLIAHADSALYRAKKGVKGAPSARRAERADNGKRRRELTRDMIAGLARGEFFLQFQPIVSLTSGRIESFEALARWRHPNRGLIPPLEFIGIAEKNGFIHELGEWIIGEACREAQRWAGKARIAINVSGEQLRDAAFAKIFDGALAASGIAANLAQIEVAESASLAVDEDAARALRQLHERGAEIVLDDFGAGASSFELIRRLPVGRLKIERRFVADLPSRRDSAAIVGAVIGLASALNLSVTAKGVESESQREYLKRVGCASAQGFFFAMPLDAERALTLVAAAPLSPAKLSAA